MAGSSCAQQHQQTESNSTCFAAVSHFIPGKLLLMTCHSKTSRRFLGKTDYFVYGGNTESVPSCCLSSPLLCTSPQFGSDRVPICRCYHTWFPPQTTVSCQNPFTSTSQTPFQLPCTPSRVNGDGFPCLVPIFLEIS